MAEVHGAFNNGWSERISFNSLQVMSNLGMFGIYDEWTNMTDHIDPSYSYKSIPVF